jgi:hypothetical protein
MTTAPLEMYADETWEVLDPNTAQLVAVFHDETAAREYLEWRNSEFSNERDGADPAKTRTCQQCHGSR